MKHPPGKKEMRANWFPAHFRVHFHRGHTDTGTQHSGPAKKNIKDWIISRSIPFVLGFGDVSLQLLSQVNRFRHSQDLPFFYLECVTVKVRLILTSNSKNSNTTRHKLHTQKQTICSTLESPQLILGNCVFKHKNARIWRQKQEDGRRSLSPHCYGGGVCRGWLTARPEIHESWISLRWVYRGTSESRQKGMRGGV